MKPITALLLVSLTVVGAACSDPVTAENAEVQTASAEVEGTLNLNIGRAEESGSGLNLGTDTSGSPDGLIVAPGATGGNFEDVPALDVELPSTPDSILDTPGTASEDDVVRLKPQ